MGTVGEAATEGASTKRCLLRGLTYPPVQLTLPAYTSEIPEAERMGTWAHGQKASRCHPIPLHLNVLDLGDAPSERELDANR